MVSHLITLCRRVSSSHVLSYALTTILGGYHATLKRAGTSTEKKEVKNRALYQFVTLPRAQLFLLSSPRAARSNDDS